LIGIVAAGAVVLSGIRRTGSLSSQADGAATPPQPKPVLTAASQQGPRGVELVPETIPFIRTSDRERIRDEYLRAPNYKALATNMFESHFVSGLPSQEIADKAAVENCESTKRRPSTDTALAEVEYRCDLFASGAVVVTQRTNIAMPPLPWVNASVQRPFDAAELPMASQETKEAAERRYRRSPRSKALVISPNGRLFPTSAESGPEEAMRRTLERCGYVSKAACLVVALDDSFVAAVPTLARAVGFYRQEALFTLPIEVRAEVARRLATSNEGWQAVALGATGHAGTEVGAVSERSAVDGAMENCAMYDHDCHIAVIGPFLVEAPPAPPAQPPPRGR
jgi:adenylate cyclase